MEFFRIAAKYEQIEATSKRLEMTDLLVSLFKEMPAEEIGKVVYLTQGRLYPDFVGVELGMSDKLAITAIKETTGASDEEVSDAIKRTGDLGSAAAEFLARKKQKTLFATPLDLGRVYDNLDRIAKATGASSQNVKIKLLSELLHDAAQSEGKYIVRAVTGNLRLGLADMTILDALAKMQAERDVSVFLTQTDNKGSVCLTQTDNKGAVCLTKSDNKREREKGTKPPPSLFPLLSVDFKNEEYTSKLKELQKYYREKIENAYNLYPDLGHIARVLAAEGIAGIEKIRIKIGVPIRAMLAERLPSIEEIIAKMEGKCGFEYKYDGLRIQAHLSAGGAGGGNGDGNGVRTCTLFSRRLEDLTEQFPDVCAALRASFHGRECIVEGECVAVNGETGEMLPFQEISHRRGRKYGVESEKIMTLGGKEKSQIKGGHADVTIDYPVSIFLFDCLYLDGEDTTRRQYAERREALKKAFDAGDRVKISDSLVSSNLDEINAYFAKAIGDGCEGLIAKSLQSLYRAGARGFQWIKYKRDYKSELADTIDLVVVGAFAGHGARTGKYGSLLMAAYNEETGRFETISRLGTGFDDKTLDEMPKMFAPFAGKSKPADVESKIAPDVWIKPNFVMEIRGAELTLSPVHTCAYGKIRKESGVAIRFPRFTGKWREDKKPEDATTAKEIVEMYRSQLKKLEE